MKDGEREIYDIKRPNGDWFSLTAKISEGRLLLSNQDFCSLAEDMFGDEEKETFYSFDEENTAKLAALFKTEDLLDALDAFFRHEMRDKEFRRFCAENGVGYIVSSW